MTSYPTNTMLSQSPAQVMISNIRSIFSIDHFEVGKIVHDHYIDMYMPRYNIAIIYSETPCDEYVKTIETQLGYTVVNITAEDNICTIANMIYIHIRRVEADMIVISRNRSVLDFPPEIILMIVYNARRGGSVDLCTLQSLSHTSKAMNGFMKRYRAEIIEQYTVMNSGQAIVSYTFCGALHRGGDLPAVVTASEQEWRRYGKYHRDNDQPARICSNGIQEWYQHGQLHRDNDRPAAIWDDGTQEWYQFNKLHRGDDKPAVIKLNGTVEWHKYGKLHRGGDKPAIIKQSGTQKWYRYDTLHRNGKPAIIKANGTQLWYINGRRVTCKVDN